MLHENPVELLALTAQELTLCKDLESVMLVVRSVVRKLTLADGVTFVLKEGDECFYADEDTMSPLWKGSRFKADFCISGWAMKHKTYVCIEDIYKDTRIPIDLYSTTYIKSLLMMPIRRLDPIGAIGCYWAKSYTPGDDEIKYLQSISDMASLSLEHIQMYSYLKENIGRTKIKRYNKAHLLFSPSKFIKRLFAIDHSMA